MKELKGEAKGEALREPKSEPKPKPERSEKQCEQQASNCNWEGPQFTNKPAFKLTGFFSKTFTLQATLIYTRLSQPGQQFSAECFTF